MMEVLLILAFLIVLGGALSITNAPIGVGAVAIGCVLAIVERIAQSADPPGATHDVIATHDPPTRV